MKKSASASTLGPQSLRGLCQSGGVLGLFPGKRALAALARLASKVPVRRGWRVDGLEQIQMLNDARWSEVIKILNQLGDVRV